MPPTRARASVGAVTMRGAATLFRRALVGAGLAAALGGLFRLAGKAGPPDGLAHVGAFLAIGALGGAFGGVLFHYLEPLRQAGRGWRIAANVAGALGYAVIVAVVLVLGAGGAD